jgi:hypothetical protein
MLGGEEIIIFLFHLDGNRGLRYSNKVAGLPKYE